MALQVGTVLSKRYTLQRILGRGGMGEVWLANDRRLDRSVAVKTVQPHYALSNPAALKILADEAAAGGKMLGHPNIVAILDLDDDIVGGEAYHYIVMEYVDGISAHAWLKDVVPKLEPATVLLLNEYIAYGIVRGIGAAHGVDILHRDIKPLNIFLGRSGRVKIGDFGLARVVSEATRSHTVGNAMTALYAAPEQWRDDKDTVETDYYQLGCTVYELLAGRPPFTHSKPLALMNAHLHDLAPSLHTIDTSISEHLSTVVDRLLSKDKDKRTNIWELQDTLARSLQNQYVLTIRPQPVNDEVTSIISTITDMPVSKDGIAKHDFPDWDEVLSEAMALALHGIYSFTVAPLVARPQARPSAAAPSPSGPATPK